MRSRLSLADWVGEAELIADLVASWMYVGLNMGLGP